MTALARKQRRPRRIAADEAHAWARNLRLGNPYAKLVLSMLTLYVNGEGSCFVGASTLADDCELALETVRRRLAWLESIGAIARFPQWVDEHGKRNSEGRGKRTTDDIRLMLDADPDEIEARAAGDLPSEDHDSSDTVSPLPDRGPDGESGNAELRPAPQLGVCQPPHCGGGLDSSEPEPEDSPQAPQRGASDADDDRDGESDHHVDGWAEFKSAFEADDTPIVRVSLAKTLFTALSPEQRAKVTRAAAGLIAHRSRQKKPGTKPSAQTFLRETDSWEAFAKQAPPLTAKRISIERGSDAYRAAAVYKMLIMREPIKLDKIEVSEQLARSPEFMALAAAAADDGAVDRSTWRQLDPENADHKQKIAAWRTRVKAWCERWLEFEKVPVLNPDGTQKVSIKEWNGQQLRFPVTREALVVPADWPPRADGSWPELDAIKKTG